MQCPTVNVKLNSLLFQLHVVALCVNFPMQCHTNLKWICLAQIKSGFIRQSSLSVCLFSSINIYISNSRERERETAHPGQNYISWYRLLLENPFLGLICCSIGEAFNLEIPFVGFILFYFLPIAAAHRESLVVHYIISRCEQENVEVTGIVYEYYCLMNDYASEKY